MNDDTIYVNGDGINTFTNSVIHDDAAALFETLRNHTSTKYMLRNGQTITPRQLTRKEATAMLEAFKKEYAKLIKG